MHPYRLRVLVADSPGSLGTVADALRRIGVSILDIDVQTDDGVLWADELLVTPTLPIDPPCIDATLRSIGVTVLDLRPAAPHHVVDATTRSLEIAGRVAHSPVDDEVLGSATAELVRADSWWCNRPGLPPSVTALTVPRGPASTALATGSPAQEITWAALRARTGATPWTLALPFDDAGERRVLVVRRVGPRFTTTEIARAQVLLRLAGDLRSARRRVEAVPA